MSLEKEDSSKRSSLMCSYIANSLAALENKQRNFHKVAQCAFREYH